MNKIALTFSLFFSFLVFIFFACLPAGTVFATTSGYAWASNAGWINFGCLNCNVQVSDSVITGYAWNENYGWINLNPATSGVKNTIAGVLSGYAWGENVGWVNFSGVNINCSGVFTGNATGDIVGTLNFNCANCDVQTDWKPSSGCGGGGVFHNECNAQQCIVVSGGGINQCNNDNNCSIACVINTDCGTDGFVDSPFCQNGNVYQNYTTYTCNNAGAINSSCTSATVAQLKTTCTQNQVCDNGVCLNQSIACTANTDCGINGYANSPFCQDGNVYQSYTTYTCNNAGAINSSCSSATEAQLKITCIVGEVCNDGSCTSQNNSHNECNGSQCISVSGIGINQCLSDSDCQQGSVHNECNSQKQCVAVSGSGENKCQTDSDCDGGGGIIEEYHNECNAQKQCVLVSGSGENKCQSDDDCNKTTETIIETIIDRVVLPEPVRVVLDETKKIVEIPRVSATAKTISTVGLVVATVAMGSFISFSLSELLLVLLRFLGFILTAFGFKKRVSPWGVVYDSVTKQPLDPAYVVLKNLQGVEVSSAITDLDGRYGFLVDPGVYNMSVSKTNYAFPSHKLAGKISDELYSDLYFGENIEVKSKGEVIVKNIPLDPLKFDWNEFTKKSKKLMRFYSKWDIWTRRIYDLLYIVGFVVAIISYVFAPYPYNTIIMLLYLVLLLFRAFGLKPKAYGYIIDKTTGAPLSFAIIRILVPDLGVEIASKSADRYGKYYCLVPPGKYIVKIEKKNDDGSYSLFYTSGIMDTSKKGIINKIFKI